MERATMWEGNNCLAVGRVEILPLGDSSFHTRPCYCFGGTSRRFNMQEHLQQKDDQILRQKLCTFLSPFFFTGLLFSEATRLYIPNSCWLNINLASASKALGQNEVSNVMLTRIGFEQSWPLGITMSYKVHRLFKSGIHYSTLINCCHVGIDSYY